MSAACWTATSRSASPSASTARSGSKRANKRVGVAEAAGVVSIGGVAIRAEGFYRGTRDWQTRRQHEWQPGGVAAEWR